MPKSAYFFYMLHFKAQQEKKGVRFAGGLDEIKDAASESWQNMTKEERFPFEDKARADKSSNTDESKSTRSQASKPSKRERFSSQGVPFSQLDADERERQDAEIHMKTRVKHFVQFLSESDGFAEYPIYLMAGNYFYIYESKYVPAELGIAKFSLAEGILNQYHSFLNPVEIVRGYRADAKLHSEETHGLPIPPEAMGEKNFIKVNEGINDIFKSGSTFDGGKPMVFTNDGIYGENVPMLKSFMNQFSKHDNTVDVFPLTSLVYNMKEIIAEKRGVVNPVTLHLAKALLDRDVFEFRRNISCKFHEENDLSKYCALSQVVRWTYLLCDILCPDVGVTLQAGKHLPRNSDTRSVAESMSRLSVQSKSDASFVSSKIVNLNDTNDLGTITLDQTDDSDFPRRYWKPGNNNVNKLQVGDGLQKMSEQKWIGAGRGRTFSMSDSKSTIGSLFDSKSKQAD